MSVRGTLGLGLAVLFAALVFDAGVLYLPGIGLILLAVVLPLFCFAAATGARVQRAPPPPTVIEGEPIELSFGLRAGLGPLIARLHDPLLPDPIGVRVLVPRARRRRDVEGAQPGRGRHRLDPPRLAIDAPFGLGSREVSGREEQSSILVLPRIEPLRAPGEGGSSERSIGSPVEDGADPAALGMLRESLADPELDGVRAYRPGSPASRIYWPAFARGGDLMERRLTAGGGSTPLVALELPVGVEGEPVEAAVRAAASLCRRIAPARGCRLLLPGESRPHEIGSDLLAWPHAHAMLALALAGSGAPALRAIGTSPLFWVTARASKGGRRGYLVAPQRIPGAKVAFTVAGCHGHAIGIRESAGSLA